MRKHQGETDRRTKPNGVNGWKWAFIILVLILIGFIVYLSFLIKPYSVNNRSVNETPIMREELTLTTSLNKEDAEVIMNEYLTNKLGEDFEPYSVAVTDHLELHGTVPILTFEVPFKLSFTPYAMENGNLQLRGESVELANFSLPVGAVMNLFARQVELPAFIDVNGEHQMITVHLDDLMHDSAFQLAVSQLDLENDRIEFNLGFDKDLLTGQME